MFSTQKIGLGMFVSFQICMHNPECGKEKEKNTCRITIATKTTKQ